MSEQERCDWCGAPVGPEEGWRAGERAGDRHAVFCRLEHVVPWVMQGAHWSVGDIRHAAGDELHDRCAVCDAELDDSCLLIVHHRGSHRIADAFCGAAHLREWAAGGGRWTVS